jgi:hypothetical protein
MRVLVAIAASFAVSCAVVTGLSDYDFVSDAGIDAIAAQIVDAAPVVDTTAPPKPCDESACVTLDPKWTPFAVAIGGGACPADATTTTAITDPVAGAGACTCVATNQVAPSCVQGTVNFKVGNGCTTAGLSTTFSDSMCHPVTSAVGDYVAYQPIAPAGGSCKGAPSTDTSKVTHTPVTLCAPTCKQDLCGHTAPPGFKACLVAAGDIACDVAGFGDKHLVGAKATLACTGNCPNCTATATCTNVSVDLFTESTCTTKVANEGPACSSTGADVGKPIDGLIYHATVVPQYVASGTVSPQSVSVTAPQTVCCAP